MNKKNWRMAVLIAADLMAAACLAGRGRPAAGDANPPGAGLSGSVRIVGSTSMRKLTNALAEGFMENYPGVTVNVEFVGSGAGIVAVAEGNADIGNTSRSLKEEEKQRGVAENLVALDGIAVCVDRENTVSCLTAGQLADIYTGAVRNWREVGGEDLPIVVVGREAGSGTRMAFEELLGIEDRCVYANELDAAGAVLARVALTPGAVGYLSLDVTDGSVRVLSLDGVAPAPENIRTGRYPLCRPFLMATKGEISVQSEPVRAWFAYVYGEEGRGIAAGAGLIPAEQ